MRTSLTTRVNVRPLRSVAVKCANLFNPCFKMRLAVVATAGFRGQAPYFLCRRASQIHLGEKWNLTPRSNSGAQLLVYPGLDQGSVFVLDIDKIHADLVIAVAQDGVRDAGAAYALMTLAGTVRGGNFNAECQGGIDGKILLA